MEAWCSGLTCGPVKAEIAGSNPVASALTKVVDNHKLHERQEIVDPLYYSPVPAYSPHAAFPATSIRLPAAEWAGIVELYMNGESLRQVAKKYGVSHETIRSIVKRAAFPCKNDR